MNKQDALDILRRHQEALRARGIVHAALFGSVARGEADTASDVDIMIELDPDLNLDIYAYAGLKNYVAGLFNGSTEVDVVNKAALKSHLRQPITTDAIYAF
jgi:predicted nucleotidyltransferase